MDLTEVRIDSLRAQLTATVATNVALTALGLITAVLVARILGPEARGELSVVQLWGPFIATLALVGLPDAVVYTVGREPWRAGESWSSATLLGLVVGVPILALGYWGLPHLLGAQTEAVISLTRAYLPAIFLLYVFGSLPLSVLRGLRHFGAWNALRCLPLVGWLAVVVGAAVLQRRTVQFLALSSLAAYGVASLITLPLVVRRVSGRFAVSGGLARKMLAYGLPLAVTSVPYWLLQSGRLAQLYVAAALEPSALGYLAVAVTWGELMKIIPLGISDVVFPRVAGADIGREAELAKAIRFSLLAIAPVGLLAVLLCPAGTSLLFGIAFRPAVPAGMVFVVWGSLEGLRNVMTAGLRGFGKASAVLASDVASALGTTSLLALLVPRLGVAGAGWAALLGTCVGASLAWWKVRAVMGRSQRVWPRRSDVEVALRFLAGLLQAGMLRSSKGDE